MTTARQNPGGRSTGVRLFVGLAGIMMIHGVVTAQGTCTPPYTPVTHTFTLNYGSKYLIAPPREPRTGGAQNITDAATLDAAIRLACPSVTSVEVGRWLGLQPNGANVALTCYPAGTTSIPGALYTYPGGSPNPPHPCLSSSNTMTWSRREGLWIRVLAASGTSCSFTWEGCDFTANTTTLGNEYTPQQGKSLVAPPYAPYAPAAAVNLFNALGGLAAVTDVRKYILASDGLLVYTGRKSGDGSQNFSIAEGEGCIANMIGGAPPEGPWYGTVLGKVYRDLNSSGTFDGGDLPIVGRYIVSNVEQFAGTGSSGSYSALAATPSYSVQPVKDPGETFVPATRTGPIAAGETVAAQDFGRQPVADLYTSVFDRPTPPSSSFNFCPGQQHDVCPRFWNPGDTTVPNAELRLALPPATYVTYSGSWSTSGTCSFVPGAPTYTVSPHRLTWSLAGIAVGQECGVCATLNLAPSLPFGTLLTATSSVYVNGGTSTQDGVDIANNTSTLTRAAGCGCVGCGEPDTDNDGVVDGNDCAPSNPAVWFAPSDALDLRVAKGVSIDLSWTPPASLGGTGVVYDVLRSTDPAVFTSGSTTTCVASDISSQAASDAFSDATSYYLVRSHNACGGTLGIRSDGNLRIGRNCP